MKRTALKIGYIGTNFHGFQRQPDLRTVEEELIYHLRKLDYIDDLKKSRFRIAGRTDAGVHSLGNVISFQSEKDVRVNEINNSKIVLPILTLSCRLLQKHPSIVVLYQDTS